VRRADAASNRRCRNHRGSACERVGAPAAALPAARPSAIPHDARRASSQMKRARLVEPAGVGGCGLPLQQGPGVDVELLPEKEAKSGPKLQVSASPRAAGAAPCGPRGLAAAARCALL
jgi:hypothetical protein